MMYAEDILHTVLNHHPCCQAWAVPFSSLEERERAYFDALAPACRAAVVLGHHVTTIAEWTWYARGEEEYCDADDHTQAVCEALVQTFTQNGFQSAIVPYPGKSGLRFRDVAQAAGAGTIGTNAFLLHPEWGPWIHLRVLATDAPVRDNPAPVRGVCTRCDACIAACPAGAIREGIFEGLKCRSYREARGEYVPVGPEREYKYCTICADVCPIGPKPR
jgi:epoxyqueuosine reductase